MSISAIFCVFAGVARHQSLFQIGYIRGLFPEEEFSTKKLSTLESVTDSFQETQCEAPLLLPSDMQVQILVPRRPESRRFIDWIECGAADALKRQYMKSLYFGISKDPKGCELMEVICVPDCCRVWRNLIACL